jgi:choline dehydrogenase
MYDFIIVGAGSAGCVLADRLSADGKSRVLVIESGFKDNHPLMHMPGATGKIQNAQKYNWGYESVPQKHLNNRRLFITQGKGIGGSSSINAMIYIRGNREDYNQWREMGNVGWGWDDVLPVFVELENNARLGGPFHGQAGPLDVTDPIAPNKMSVLFTQAAEQIGVARRDDFNTGDQEGTGLFQFTIRNGVRWSAARAFLDKARTRKNVEVVTNRTACKIIVENGKAVGIAAQSDDREVVTYRASREVILAAGVFGSPKLLLLSGIGPADELRDVGVKPVHDLPGVGKNYHDHVDIRTVHRCLSPWTYDGQDKFLPALRHGLEYVLLHKGMVSSSPCQAATFVRSRPDVETPDISLYFLPVGFVDHGRVKVPGRAVTLHNNIMRPLSRGEVKLRSPNPADMPLIDPNFLSHPADMDVMVECVRWARKVMAAPLLAKHIGPEIFPGQGVQSVEDIKEYVRANAEIDYHPVGSCKMGHDRLAVVDDRLRVHGLSGLRVVDASIMPNVISGNTNAPTMMIAAKAAKMIIEDQRAVLSAA